MQVFVVERDMAGSSMGDLAGMKRAAMREAQRMHDEGDRVRYIRSVFVPQDGRCLCLFEAKNAEVVSALNRAALLPFQRILAAMDIAP